MDSKNEKKLELDGSQRLTLNDESAFWLIQAGAVDVFATGWRDQQPAGPLIHLFRALPGDCLWGIKAQDHVLLAVGTPGTVMAQRVVADLVSGGLARQQSLVFLMENWLINLYQGLFRQYLVPRQSVEMLAPGEKELTAGQTLYAPVELMWLKVPKDAGSFLGEDEWPALPEYLPTAKPVWLKMKAAGVVTAVGTDQLVEDGRWAECVQAFNAFYLQCLEHWLERRSKHEHDLLTDKVERDEAALAGARIKLANVLTHEHLPSRPAKGETGLLAACRLVAEVQGFAIDTKITGVPSLEDVARAAKFRYRCVTLTGNWWRDDNGPLLVFRKETHEPLALLPEKSNSYRLYDPSRDSWAQVTAAVAQTLETAAYYFYRPFPSQTLTTLKLTLFGLYGTKIDFWRVLVLGTVGGLLALLTPILSGEIFSTVIPEGARSDLLQLAVVLFTSAVATGLLQLIRSLAVLRIEGRMNIGLESAFISRLISLPTNFFRQFTAGDLANRVLGIEKIEQMISGISMSSLLSLLFSLFSFALLFYYSASLAMVAFVLSIIGVAVTIIANRYTVYYQRQVWDLYGKNTGMAYQFLTGIAKLWVAGAETRAYSRWANSFADQRDVEFKGGVVTKGLSIFYAVYPLATTMGIFMWMSWVMKGMPLGDFVAFNSAFASFQASMQGAVMALNNLYSAKPIYKRMEPILTTLPECDESKVRPGELSGAIDVSHASFRYSDDAPWILRDVSLKIAPGQFVAIVGPTGCGKSTLLRLLLGFEKPQTGSVFYDGQELAALDIHAVRHQIGVVLQNGALMPGDIFKNIVGIGNLTIDDAWEAARMVGLDDDIHRMPMGMHTYIASDGSGLSGGQRQRILIARAIVHRPRLLFFDEATSALDNRSQAIVQESIDKLRVTRVVIAHRLSTIAHADVIYVLKGGKVVESGKYEELMAQGGFFAELAKRQVA